MSTNDRPLEIAQPKRYNTSVLFHSEIKLMGPTKTAPTNIQKIMFNYGINKGKLRNHVITLALCRPTVQQVTQTYKINNLKVKFKGDQKKKRKE